jgi:hypothetical protein
MTRVLERAESCALSWYPTMPFWAELEDGPLGKGKAAGFHSCADGFAVCRAAPCVHPARARRIAANIAKLPELLQKT